MNFQKKVLKVLKTGTVLTENINGGEYLVDSLNIKQLVQLIALGEQDFILNKIDIRNFCFVSVHENQLKISFKQMKENKAYKENKKTIKEIQKRFNKFKKNIFIKSEIINANYLYGTFFSSVMLPGTNKSKLFVNEEGQIVLKMKYKLSKEFFDALIDWERSQLINKNF